MFIGEKIGFWFKNARPVSLPQSLLPAAVALGLAASQRPAEFSLFWGLLAVLGVALAHLSLNLFDDYFDYSKLKSDYRRKLAAKGKQARTSKCPYLLNGSATQSELLLACLAFGAAACLCGLPILLVRGSVILWPVVLCLFLGFFYSAPPLRLSYHGLGEIIIGIIFGPLLMLGVYLSACGSLDFVIWPLAVSMGLLVCNIAYVHSLLDIAPDKYAGKSSLPEILPTPDAKRWGSFIFTFGAFGIMEILTIVQVFPPAWLLTLLALPLAAAAYASVKVWLRAPHQPFPRLWWFGPMANWPAICAQKLDWFMVRWYLARNLMVWFSLCSLAACWLDYLF